MTKDPNAVKKNARRENGEDPTYARGATDAKRGYPPREGSKQYLEGYASEYHELPVSSRNDARAVG